MGGAAPVEGKKGKKSLDAELNLVPFIDLLSCLIAFLLISAVWTQVSSVKVASTGGLTQEQEQEPNDKVIPIRVTLTDQGYSLSLAGNVKPLPKVSKTDGVGQTFDTKTLVEALKVVKQSYPEQRAVTVAAEDSVVFEDLIATVDKITGKEKDGGAELPDVSVTPAVN